MDRGWTLNGRPGDFTHHALTEAWLMTVSLLKLFTHLWRPALTYLRKNKSLTAS